MIGSQWSVKTWRYIDPTLRLVELTGFRSRQDAPDFISLRRDRLRSQTLRLECLLPFLDFDFVGVGDRA